jgi:hypothetical protein
MSRVFLVVIPILLNLSAFFIAWLVSVNAILYPYADSEFHTLSSTIDRDVLDAFQFLSFLGIISCVLSLLFSSIKLVQGGLTKNQKFFFIGLTISSTIITFYFIYRLTFFSNL